MEVFSKVCHIGTVVCDGCKLYVNVHSLGTWVWGTSVCAFIHDWVEIFMYWNPIFCKHKFIQQSSNHHIQLCQCGSLVILNEFGKFAKSC